MTDIELETQIEGLDEHVRKLSGLSGKDARKVLRSAFNGSTAPIKTSLRRFIRQRILRFGHLLKSIRSKVKSYASGVVVVLVGARDRKLGNGENPGKYFHLADGGTKPHPIELKVLRVNGVFIRVSEFVTVQHPGSEPREVRADAFRTSRPKVDAKFRRAFTKRLTKLISQ